MIQKTVSANITAPLASLAQKCRTLNQLKQIHAYLLKYHLDENPLAIGPLLSVSATSKNSSFFSYARLIFDHSCQRNTFMYNTMIRGYMQANLPKFALLSYFDMLTMGFEVNNYTFPPLIKACTILAPSIKEFGRLVHTHVVKFGCSYDLFVVSSLIEFYSFVDQIETARLLFDRSLERDVVMWTTLIDGYGKVGNVENAREMFEKMPERNAISWSAIMAAYSRVNDFKEVLLLFSRMQKEKMKPNESVLVSVLTACAHLGAISQGLWVHSYAKRHNLDRNMILATAIVDMYSKCGHVESALSVFNDITDKDAGAWNAMISGFAMNGYAGKAIDLFDQMIKSGARPTETTFVALFTTCTHANMVDEGLKLFKQMDNIYGVKPQLEHYACVVDLLGRAGMVEEAEKFMETEMGGMIEGDANVWGALLGACRIYGNVEVGNRVWKKVNDMGRADCGTHVLSYNLYKEAGWDLEAKRVRRVISDSGMKKKPGCSVIEVNGVIQEFLAGETSHPQAPEIFKVIDSSFRMANLKEI